MGAVVMAKVGKRPERGPYLATAVICEKMLLESDRVISAMRIVDTMTLPLAAIASVQEGTVIALQTTLLVSFKAGDFRGKRQLRITMRAPSGEQEPFLETEMDFAGAQDQPEAGNNIGVHMHVKWRGPGLYWLDIFLGDRSVTRVPFRLQVGNVVTDKQASKEKPAEANLTKVQKGKRK
jgi:hypothetical protein